MARPVASVAVTAAAVAAGVPGGTDAEWVRLISPGFVPGGDNSFGHWSMLWVQNDTDANLDFAQTSTPQQSLTAADAAAKTRIITLKATTAPYAFDLAVNGEFINGPIYVRGTTADPGSGNVYAGGRLA